MSAVLFYVVDQGGSWPYHDLGEAREHAQFQVDEARRDTLLGFDEEWSLNEDDVAIYACDGRTSDPESDGRLIVRLRMVALREVDADGIVEDPPTTPPGDVAVDFVLEDVDSLPAVGSGIDASSGYRGDSADRSSA